MNLSPTKINSDYFKAALIYAVLVLVFFYPVFQGKVITQTDFLNFVSPWDAVNVEGLTAPSNSHLQDQSTEFLPFFMEAKRQFAAGDFPLWNPYIFAGNPLWANTQSALLFPLNLFHYVLEPPLGFTISALLKLFFACFFMYVFIRKLSLAHYPALLSGVAFGFCAFTVFWLNHPHINVVCLIPLSFYMVERLLQQRDAKNISGFALVVALTLIAGHVEIAFLTAAGCGLYYLIRLVQLKKFTIKALLAFFTVYGFGLLLAAVLVFPFIEFLFNTAIWTERDAIKQLHIPTAGLINLFMGEFFIFNGWHDNQIGFHAFSPYVGVACLPLAVYAARVNFKQSLPFLLLTLLSLAVAFGVNPFYFLVKSLPLFNHLPLFYFSVLAAFGTAVLAAMGLHQVIKQQPKITDMVVLLATAALTYVAIKWFWQPGDLSPFVQSATDLVTTVRGYADWLILALVLVILLMTLANRFSAMASVLLIALVFVDLFQQGHEWNPVVEKAHALPTKTPAALNFLQSQSPPFRTVGYDYILKPSTNMLAQVHDIRGYDVPVIDRYHHFFNQALNGKDAFWYYDLAAFDPDILPFLDILNVRFLLSKKDLSAKIPPQIELVYDDEIKIYQNQQAKGLAYMVQQSLWVDSAEQALAQVINQKLNLSDVVVLEGDQAKHLDEGPVGSISNHQHIEYGTIKANQVDMQVTTTQNAWLIFSQNHYPGWQASINGEKTTIFAANYVLQAIKIPAGSHSVTFTYKPFSFTLGWVVSLSSLIFALWIIRRKTK
ncbi:YfhO family protein [Marinicella litoralis]|uniref:Membrane protein YfhO n=1 Tax=Marinicella litoralis TaxID=644220 RepID=A0A4R6XL69_9GAMM|nr:YfhO family protein [Marinicella litoralis]TDR20345.1 membrane protein YfhO [Marinicella litoralis]